MQFKNKDKTTIKTARAIAFTVLIVLLIILGIYHITTTNDKNRIITEKDGQQYETQQLLNKVLSHFIESKPDTIQITK